MRGQAVRVVVVREWSPATAPAAELETLVAILNDVLGADVPGDPPWLGDRMRDYLTETMPGERRICWLSLEDGQPIGHANLLLLTDIGVIEAYVHPAARNRGIGRALVAAAARRAYEEGVGSIGVEAIGDTPAVKFWESLGFRCAYVERRSILDLSSVDWERIGGMAATVPDGYRIEHHPAGLPKQLLEPYAAAKASRREAVAGEPELHPSSYDAQRLADSLDTLNRRGMKPYLVLAVHDQSGEVAALTELVVPAQHPSRGDQYDTIVVPDHQRLGLEQAIKARMLLELRGVEPRLTEVQTWNALENNPMAEVNAALGFRPDREWYEYEADVLDLIRQL